MKIIFLSDLHLSWDSPVARIDKDFVEMQFQKLDFVFDYAQKHDCVVLQAGDFFETPRSWHLLSRVFDFLKKYFSVKVFSIFGQHDMYMRLEDTATTNLGVLEKSNYVKILNKYPVRIQDNVFVYGCSWGQKIPKVKEDGLNIFVIHATIAEDALWHGQEYMNAEKFLEKNKDFDIILCGDIHRKFLIEKKGRYILNTGPLVRRSADEYNYSHKICFYVYDTNYSKIKEVIIPHKFAKEVLSRNHIEREQEIEILLEEFISSIKSEGIYDVDLLENLKKFIEENNISENVEKIIARKISENEE